MKKFLLVCFFSVAVLNGFPQEFSFQLNFEDAIGNKDSIVLGYDVNATQGVDSVFNEIDISSLPWDTILDVRAISLYGTSSQFDYSITENSGGINCFNSWNQFAVLTNHWPVKISWDSTLFTNLCQPIIEISNTDLLIYGDVVCWFGDWLSIDLREQSSVIYETATPLYGLCDGPDENVPDSAKFCFVAFSEGLGLPEIKPAELQLYPNPATTTLTIQTTEKITSLSIYNAQGQEVKSLNHQFTNSQIDISQFPKGIYVLLLNGSTARRVVIE